MICATWLDIAVGAYTYAACWMCHYSWTVARKDWPGRPWIVAGMTATGLLWPPLLLVWSAIRAARQVCQERDEGADDEPRGIPVANPGPVEAHRAWFETAKADTSIDLDEFMDAEYKKRRLQQLTGASLPWQRSPRKPRKEDA